MSEYDYFGVMDMEQKIYYEYDQERRCERCSGIKRNLNLLYCEENIQCLKMNIQNLLNENLKYQKELEKYKKE